MNDLRVMKGISNRNFYIIGFLVSFVLFYLLRVVFQFGLLFYFESKTPGFANDFANLSNQENGISLFTNEMWSVLNLSQFFGTLVLTIGLIPFLKRPLIKGYNQFKKNIWNNIGAIIIGFLFVMLVQSIIGLIFNYFNIEGTSENQDSIVKALSSSTRIFILLSVVVIAPIVEELLFRQLLHGLLQESFKLPRIITVFISAALFASLHATDIFFIQYFSMALILSGSYALFKENIFIPIGIHFLNNALVLVYAVLYLI